MTIKVRMVELSTPPIMGAATRCITSDPVPSMSMIGRRPAMVEQVVIMIGRRRCSAAFTVFSIRSSGSGLAAVILIVFNDLFRNPSITIPLSTATPARAINPMPAAMDRLKSRIYSNHTPPPKANGRVAMIRHTSVILRKFRYNKMNMMKRVTGTTIDNLSIARFMYSYCPDHARE